MVLMLLSWNSWDLAFLGIFGCIQDHVCRKCTDTKLLSKPKGQRPHLLSLGWPNTRCMRHLGRIKVTSVIDI